MASDPLLSILSLPTASGLAPAAWGGASQGDAFAPLLDGMSGPDGMRPICIMRVPTGPVASDGTPLPPGGEAVPDLPAGPYSVIPPILSEMMAPGQVAATPAAEAQPVPGVPTHTAPPVAAKSAMPLLPIAFVSDPLAQADRTFGGQDPDPASHEVESPAEQLTRAMQRHAMPPRTMGEGIRRSASHRSDIPRLVVAPERDEEPDVPNTLPPPMQDAPSMPSAAVPDTLLVAPTAARGGASASSLSAPATDVGQPGPTQGGDDSVPADSGRAWGTATIASSVLSTPLPRRPNDAAPIPPNTSRSDAPQPSAPLQPFPSPGSHELPGVWVEPLRSTPLPAEASQPPAWIGERTALPFPDDPTVAPVPGGSRDPVPSAPQVMAPLTFGRVVAETTAAMRVEPQRRAGRPAPQPLPAILPAMQAFGAALQTAWAAERKPNAPVVEPAALIAPSTGPAAITPEQGQPTLDTADRGWPQAMVERIERLQDAADATSTRIRLLPDALGAIDVAVQREGELVHVQFTAAEAQTRQLLADAQPRLADAADARGWRLGRTDVAGGDMTGQHSSAGERQQRPPATPPHSTRPDAARAPDRADPTDLRIA